MFARQLLRGRKYVNFELWYILKRNTQQASESKFSYNLQTYLPPQREKEPKIEPVVKNVCFGKLDSNVFNLHEVQTHDRFKEFFKWLKPIDDYIYSCVNEDGKLDKKEILNNLRDLEVFRACIPEENQGLNLSETELLKLVETVSEIPWLGTYLTKNHIVPVQLLSKYGSAEQKSEYFPRIMSGEIIPIVCIKEGSNGTNINNIKSCILPYEEDTWMLSGTKTSVVNGVDANLFLVFARDHKDKSEVPSFSLALVEKNQENVTCTDIYDTIGPDEIPICTINFNDVVVHNKNIIGTPGSGFKIMMNSLVPGKQNITGQAISLLKNFMNQLVMDVIEIKHFDRDFYKFDAVKKTLGDMAISLYAMESMAYLTSSLSDLFKDQDVELEKIITEMYCARECLKHIHAGLQLMGAQSYLNKNSYIKTYHDALSILTFDMNNIDANVYVASVALQHCGNHLHGDIFKKRNSVMFPFYVWKQLNIAVKKLDIKVQGLHPALIFGCNFLKTTIQTLDESVEQLFVRHGARLADLHMELFRLTEMLTQVYKSIAALSRSSRSYTLGLRLAEQEKDLALSISFLANTKVAAIAQDIKNEDHVNGDYIRKLITDWTYEKHQYPLSHPLNRTF